MSYPGSDTLSSEIQQRVLTTFEQTVELAASGSVQEAKLGCDFILQLDSLFQPARLLRERLENATGAVPTDDLLQMLTAGAPAAGGALSVDLEGLDDLDLDLPDEPLDSTAATDLGFATAEDSAALPALDTDSGGIDLGSSSDGETDSRIDELLAEGQTAFEDKRYQGAIDAWSRIFLIDVDHAEASRRIELARNLKAEHERQVEESFHEAMSLLEAGSTSEAEQALESVLAMQPDHMAAQDYLGKVRAGTLGAAPAPAPTTPAAAPPPATPPPPPGESEGASDLKMPDISDVDELLQDALVDAPPADVDIDSEPISEMPTSAVKAGKGSLSKAFLGIGAGVLLLVLAAGWFLWTKWDSMFPNSSETAAATAAKPDPIARAQKLHAAGNTANAIGILRRLPPDDPDYEEAQALIDQWQTAQQETPAEEADSGPNEEDLALRSVQLAQAREAFDERTYLRADSLLSDASAIQPLDGAWIELQQAVDEKIEPLASELSMFRQDDWEYAVPKLWRVIDGDPENRDARRMLVDAYYNLGVRDLQRGDMKSAANHFAEVTELDPEDADGHRLLDFSNTYLNRSEDLLYRTFVKYLPFRQL